VTSKKPDPELYLCCEHCPPHDPIWVSLGIPHTTPCRACERENADVQHVTYVIV